MKEKKLRLGDRLAVTAGLGLLLCAGLFALLFPHGDFSEAERRYLAPAPEAPSLSEWKTDKETESYLSDRIPLRNVLVGIDAGVQAATLRRTELGAWPVAGAFLEPPVKGTAEKTARRLEQFAALAEKIGASWSAVVPRSHGYLLRGRMNALLRLQYAQETPIYEALEADGHFIDALPEGTDPEEAYYRTDHHWTLQGAYMAYGKICREAGLPVRALQDFRRSSFPGFLGTTRSRSGLPALSADTLECAEPEGASLTVSGEEWDHLIFPERAETYDGYAVYLDGNHGLAEIRNPAAPGGTLLVFRDSFASCLLPLLSADWQRIVAVDARYYAGSFSRAAEEAVDVDRILFVYSPDSLLNDTSLAGKLR